MVSILAQIGMSRYFVLRLRYRLLIEGLARRPQGCEFFEGASLLTFFFCYNNRAQGVGLADNLLRSLFHSTKE